MRNKLMQMLLVLCLLLVISGVAEACTGGCTPGYWKNHLDSWPVAPTTLVTAWFPDAGTGNMTLLQALSLQGGPGVEGAERILLRAAVAAVLNAMTLGSAYDWWDVAYLKDWVYWTIGSWDRDTYLSLAATLDADNNTGCPLN